MDRNLIDYLPPILKDYSELKAITFGEQPEIELLWSATEYVENNQYIADAAGYGIARWEKALGISAKAMEGLEDRRKRLLIRMNEKLPYTVRSLRRQLADVCGEDGFILEIIHNSFSMHVKLKEVSHITYMDVLSMLDRIVPANMQIELVVEHDLPDVFVDIYHHNVAVIRKTVIDWDLFYQSNTSAITDIVPDMQVYKRITIN